MTVAKIGNQSIADYIYNANNGFLAGIEYGGTDVPQAGVNYTYDALDRVEEIKYYDNNTMKSVHLVVIMNSKNMRNVVFCLGY